MQGILNANPWIISITIPTPNIHHHYMIITIVEKLARRNIHTVETFRILILCALGLNPRSLGRIDVLTCAIIVSLT